MAIIRADEAPGLRILQLQSLSLSSLSRLQWQERASAWWEVTNLPINREGCFEYGNVQSARRAKRAFAQAVGGRMNQRTMSLSVASSRRRCNCLERSRPRLQKVAVAAAREIGGRNGREHVCGDSAFGCR